MSYTKKEKNQIIKAFQTNELYKIVFEFSCGGDSFEYFTIKFFNENEETDKFDNFKQVIESLIFNIVEFYENSTGDYYGEYGTVEITYDKETEQFLINKSVTAEGYFTTTMNISLNDLKDEKLYKLAVSHLKTRTDYYDSIPDELREYFERCVSSVSEYSYINSYDIDEDNEKCIIEYVYKDDDYESDNDCNYTLDTVSFLKYITIDDKRIITINKSTGKEDFLREKSYRDEKFKDNLFALVVILTEYPKGDIIQMLENSETAIRRFFKRNGIKDKEVVAENTLIAQEFIAELITLGVHKIRFY